MGHMFSHTCLIKHSRSVNKVFEQRPAKMAKILGAENRHALFWLTIAAEMSLLRRRVYKTEVIRLSLLWDYEVPMLSKCLLNCNFFSSVLLELKGLRVE